MAIADNTTHYIHNNEFVDYGRNLQERWFDIINGSEPQEEKPEDTRPADEIVLDMWKRIRGN